MSTDITYNIYTCRVCLIITNGIGVSLDKNPKMLEIFEFCVGYAVDLNLSPTTICQKCIEEIENFAKFKRKCSKSEEHWKSTNIDISKYHEPCYLNQSHNIEEATDTYEKVDSTSNICKEKIIFKKTDRQQYIKSDLSYMINNDSKQFNEKSIDGLQHLKDKYVCCKCKKEYSKYKWLLTHQMNVCYKHKYNKNMDKQIIVCDIKMEKRTENISSNDGCGLCSTTLNDMKSHLDEHWKNNDLSCKICSYTGKDFANMIAHRRVHSNKMKLFCHACNKKKASMLSLEFHFRSVHLHKIGGLCSICSKTFTKFKTWKKHIRLHNEENKLFICDICGKKFLYRHEITSHLIDHSDVRQFVCETCGKDFKRMSALKEHIANMHRQNDPVKCSHCSKIYKSQTKLNIHLKNISKQKLFICKVCSKRFVSENVLKKHMFWHTGERPYSCEVCGLKYKAKGQLNLHMRNHTGFMPHKCPDCGKGFPTGKQLKRHISVHTGVRAHKCLHCERSFHEKKALLEHGSLHKNIEHVKLETGLNIH